MQIVPGVRRWRGRPISLLQRIGWGYVVAAVAMVVAALVEVARLNVVADYGLQSSNYEVTPVPMSIWWQVREKSRSEACLLGEGGPAGL